MRLDLIVALAAFGLLTACAASPDSIPPSYVSTMAYRNWSCDQLAEEEGRLQAAYVTAAGEQSDARTTDTYGVLLLGLPVGSMTGENVAAQVASLKGQLDAVHQSETLKNCGSEGSLGPDARPYAGAPSSQQFQSFSTWQSDHPTKSDSH